MNFIKNLWLNRRILINLIKSDFRNRYLGSYLGIVWAFIQPVVMILVYWFVFVHGFRSPPVEAKLIF